jgi:hypothetical protein
MLSLLDQSTGWFRRCKLQFPKNDTNSFRRQAVKNIPRLLIALAIFLSGAALVPFVGLPQVGFTWQRYADAYNPTGIEIDHSSGQPGSFFTLMGHNFSPNSTATIRVNGRVLGTLTTDATGGFTFQIDSTGADPGIYLVDASVNVNTRTSFVLDPNQPLHAQAGQGTIFNLPAGIAFTKQVILPILMR